MSGEVLLVAGRSESKVIGVSLPVAGAITLFDAHVHVYLRADVASLLSAAARHFRETATAVGATDWYGVLFLTEIAGTSWFETVAGARDGREFGAWRITGVPTDPLSLEARSETESLHIVAGRQIVTSERVEVHALGTREAIADGMELSATVHAVRAAEALAVLPWGVGKWLGERGRLVGSILASDDADLFVSDNSGRPWFWRDPLLARVRAAGRPVLRGSDPLPLHAEELRVGEFGCWFDGIDRVAADRLIARIKNSAAEDLYDYGASESSWRFLRNQILLRLKR